MAQNFSVRVPRANSFTSEIAFSYNVSPNIVGLVVLNHTLFEALPDDAKVYTWEEQQDWELDEKEEEYYGTMKDLREIRATFMDYLFKTKAKFATY